MAKRMRNVLSEMGYDPEGFRSRGVNSEDVKWADQIIVMGNAHLKYFNEHYPEVKDRITLWPIPDPHFARGSEAHKSVAEEIKQRILGQFS